jgi:hypothetical protein
MQVSWSPAFHPLTVRTILSYVIISPTQTQVLQYTLQGLWISSKTLKQTQPSKSVIYLLRLIYNAVYPGQHS